MLGWVPWRLILMRFIPAVGAALVALILFCGLSEAKSRKDVPLAPLPARILNAKKVFLVNGGGSGGRSDLGYDTLYAAVKDWGRFQIVDSSTEADIVMELRDVTEDGGTRVWSSTNTYTGATNVHSAHVTDPQIILTVYDPTSKEALWSSVEHRQLARREKNREKETINATQKLVNNMKARLGSR
jgi:hypothetical protein